MSAELSLSTRTLRVLTPSIMIIMTSGSSWLCFTLLASSSERYKSSLVRLCFDGGILWTLFTCLWYDFLRDLNDPPVMVFISPSALCGRGWGQSSSLRALTCWLLCPYLPKSPLFTYCCSFPLQMSSSICSFRSLHSSV